MATISYDGHGTVSTYGKTIFDFADVLGVRIPTSCGRAGTCHECVVKIETGMEGLCPRTDTEQFLQGNLRLACQSEISNSEVDIQFRPLNRKPRILTSGIPKTGSDVKTALDPAVKRQGDIVYRGTDKIGHYQGSILGLAVDVGTTTVAMELVNLESGELLSTNSLGNPQLFGGSDIMTRISYDSGEFQGELHSAIINGINAAILSMSRDTGTKRRQIYEVAISGNSTMRDLLFGIDVQELGQRPYKSKIEKQFYAGKRTTTALTDLPHRLGLLTNPRASIYGLPLIASHVGADTAASLVAMDMADKNGTVMLVDVGTNTEVVARRGGQMIAASCPAGPAFEGGHVSYGMPAYEGAIEKLHLLEGKFRYQTIGNARPEGFCGSGLIDLLAELRRHHMMTEKGVFTHDRKAKKISILPEHDITFSREDASNLAQAKAANYCGQVLVTRALGVPIHQIDNLYLAGGFVNYIDIKSAIEIGFLPPLSEQRIIKIGNASLQGCREVLLSISKRMALEELVTKIDHIELETAPDFFEIFVDGCQIEPMKMVRPASK